jgi:hypothetical protein
LGTPGEGNMAGDRMGNVILISLDTLRYDSVGASPDKGHLAAWGAEGEVHTPNLDRFLAECVYFTGARTTAPYTTAAHASAMTGLAPNRHGVRAFYKWALAEGVGTLAEELRARGYHTVAVQESGETTALRTGSGVLRGFDAFFRDEREACAHCAAGSGPCLLFVHTFDVHAPYCWSALDPEDGAPEWHEAVGRAMRRLGRRLPDGALAGDKTRLQGWVAREATRAMGGQGAAQLMLEWYLSGVRRFDMWRWPRILRALREAGLYDGALTIVFADHGEALLPDCEGEPMGHATSVLEDAVRVPLALHGPGLQARRDPSPASLVDMVPTVLDWLGMEPTVVGAGGDLDGQSLLQEPRDSGAGRALFAEAWQAIGPTGRAAPGDAMLLRHVEGPVRPYQLCAVEGPHKVTWHPGVPVLRRFMSRRQLARAVLRRSARRFLPGPLLRLRRRLRRRAGVAPEQTWGWHPAPTFAVDLREDPLELRPRPVPADSVERPVAALLALMRDYWQRGVTGRPIHLDAADDRQVLQHLRGLGYVE